MSITLKPNAMKYRDPDDGQYKGVDVIAETTTAEQISIIQEEGADQVALVQAASDAAQSILPTASTLNNMSDDFATQYSYLSTYDVGDYVMHDYILYRCKTAIIVAESWDVSKWDQVDVGREIESLNQQFTTSISPNLLKPSDFSTTKTINSAGQRLNGSAGSSNIINVEGASKIAIYAPADNTMVKTHNYSFASDDVFSASSVVDHGTITVKKATDPPETSVVVLTVPEGAKYFAFGFNNSTQRNFVANLSNPYAQVQIGDTITDWRAYGDMITYLSSIVQSAGSDPYKIMSQSSATKYFAAKEGNNLSQYQLENRDVHFYLQNSDTEHVVGEGDAYYPNDYTTSLLNTTGYKVAATSNKVYSGANRKDHPAPVRLVFDNVNNNVGNLKTGIWITDGNSFDKYRYYPAQNGCAEIYNLIPGKSYKYRVYSFDEAFNDTIISDGNFTTANGVRMCKISGIQNVRDIGGWSVPNSKRVKYEMLYRGCELFPESESDSQDSRIWDEGITAMREELGVRAELDMTAFTHYSSPLGNDIEFIQVMIGMYSDVIVPPSSSSIDYRPYFKTIVEWIVDQLTEFHATVYNSSATYNKGDYCLSGLNNHMLYRALVDITEPEAFNSEHWERVKYRNESRPIFFHCQGGADRTGTVTALILALLGVSEFNIAEDYELTAFSQVGYSRRRSNANYSGFISALKTAGGSTNINESAYSWAVNMCNISEGTISDLRNLMLEDVN